MVRTKQGTRAVCPLVLWRAEHRYNQGQAAQALGLTHRNHYSRLELGQLFPRRDRLDAMDRLKPGLRVAFLVWFYGITRDELERVLQALPEEKPARARRQGST